MMRLPTVFGAVGLLSAAVEAAPRGGEVNNAEAVGSLKRRFDSPRAFRPRHAPRAEVSPLLLFNLTNSSTIATSPATSTNTGTILPANISTTLIDCPTLSVFVSTKTVDVTVYVSAGSNHTITEPCDDGPTNTPHTQTTRFTISNTTTASCDDESSAHLTTTENGRITLQADEPCTDDVPYGNSTKTIATNGRFVNTTKTTDSGQITLHTDEPFTDDVPYGNSTKTIATNGRYVNTTKTADNGESILQTDEPCTDDPPYGSSTRTITTNGPYGNTTKTTDNGQITLQTDDVPYGNSTRTVTTDGPYGNSTKTSTGSQITMTEDCDDETATIGTTASVPRNSSVTLTATSTHPGNLTLQTFTVPATVTSTEDYGDEDPTKTLTTTAPGNITMQTFTMATTTTSTDDCDDTTTKSRTPTAPFGNSSVPLTSRTFTTVTPTTTKETCVIDTAMTPVETATVALTPTTPAPQPTQTICEHNVLPGAPSQGNVYCGVRGKPVGTYFIAEFIEERPGVPVSPEGCFQFCDSVMDSTRGCQAYRFYHSNAGAPRCALYGMPVSWDVRELDENRPDVWYDLACGSPQAQQWHVRVGIRVGLDLDI